MYSIEKILVRCPEKWDEHILLEWTIRESNSKIGYLLHLVGALNLMQLERIRDELIASGSSNTLFKHLKTLYFIDPLLISFVLKCLQLPFKIKEDEINQEYVSLIEIIIKQNDIIKHAIDSKASIYETKVEAKGESKNRSTLDIHDTIIEIIQLNLVQGLTLLNYKDIFTYRQLEFYAKKASNFHKKQMLQFYEPFLHGLSMAFSKKEDKIPDFRQMLFTETEEKKMSKYELNRKIWFHDKWDDEAFVRNRALELGFELELFFPEETNEEEII